MSSDDDGKEYGIEIEILCPVFQSENLENTVIIPDIKLHSNPSAFNIYCNVRHCVLEWQKKETSLAAASKNSVQSGESDSDEEEESKEPPIKLPKVRHLGSTWMNNLQELGYNTYVCIAETPCF